MGRVSLRSTVVAAKDQISADLAGEAVLLHLKSGVYYGLNPVGARVWDLLKTPTPVRQISRVLLEEYRVDPQRCEQDLLALLQELETEGLIEMKHGATS